MKTLVAAIPIVALLAIALLPAQAGAWTRSPATTFATLPADAANPEGIAVDEDGNVYVTTFAVSRPAGPGTIYVFNSAGKLQREVAVAGSSQLLLELAFHPDTGDLLVLDFGAGQVLKVDSDTGESEVFASGFGENPGINVMTFDGAGNVYISDSFQGIVWRTGPNGEGLTAWVDSPLLRTSGVPPFGANGLAFNGDESVLYVSNTGNDTVVRIPLSNGDPGAPEVFVNSINGADGLIIDEDGNLWVAANQSDEIVVIDPTGRVIAKLGDFGGIGPDGAPNGLLFPASLIRNGDFLYVTNLALDLRLFGLAPTANTLWSADVTTHTISKIRAKIPVVQGGN